MAVGAYTLALLYDPHLAGTWSPELVVVAIACSAAVGWMIGVPATRLHGPYLAGMTLILALALPYPHEPVQQHLRRRPGPDRRRRRARPGPSTRSVAGLDRAGRRAHRAGPAGQPALSRFGRAFRAVRDDEVAAALAGIHVARTKVIAFVVRPAAPGWPAPSWPCRPAWSTRASSRSPCRSTSWPAWCSGGRGRLMGAWWGAIMVVYLPDELGDRHWPATFHWATWSAPTWPSSSSVPS